MDAEAVMQRAHRAERLLADEDIRQAFADVEREVFLEWQAARHAEERESLHAVVRALGRIRAKLESWRDEKAFLERHLRRVV